MIHEPRSTRIIRAVSGAAALFLSCYAGTSLAQGGLDGDRHDCVIEPKLTVKLGGREQGTIATIKTERGAIVKQGAVVVELDSEMQKLAVEVVRLRATSDLEIQTAKARLEFQGLELARAKELHSKGVASAKKLDEITVEEQIAAIAVKTAQLQLKVAQSELDQAQERLERRLIRSPIDGLVTDVTMALGEFVYDQSVLMTIAMLDPLKIEAFVPISIYRDVLVGGTAEIEIGAPVNEVQRATVVVVDKVFDASSGTFGVRLEMPNADYRLPAGMRCKVRFQKRVSEVGAPSESNGIR